MKPRTLSREEVYELVWTRTTKQVGAEWGCKERQVANICDRHEIPHPGSGYWQNLRAGRPQGREPLLPPKDPANAWVQIGGKRNLENRGAGSPIRVRRSGAPEHRIAVGTEEYLALRRKGTVREDLCPPHVRVDVAPRSEKRVVRLLDALFQEFERRGFHLQTDPRDKRVCVRIQNQEFKLGIEGDARGRLMFSFEDRLHASRCADIGQGDADRCLDLLIADLVKVAQERTEAERLKVEKARQQEEAREALKAEEQERERWLRAAEDHRRAENLRAFAAKVRQAVGPVAPGSELGRRLAWLEALAEEVDPLPVFLARILPERAQFRL